MTARVLVVDDIPANVKLLEARLSAEYFDVVTAVNGADALAICERAECDVVLLDVMMPDMDGFEVCRRLKSNPATHHVPVIMVTALDQPSDRVKGLQAGADDFLTKPVSDVALIARVRSLTRLKMMTDELRMRAVTSRDIGIESPEREAVADTGLAGQDPDRRRPAGFGRAAPRHAAGRAYGRYRDRSERSAVPRRRRQLRPGHRLARAREFRRPAAVQPGALARAHAQRRDPGDRRRREQHAPGARARDRRQRLPDAPDRQERADGARAHADPKKRYTERLRDNVQASIEMAITDALTGLFNRRYMETHVGTLVEQATSRGKPLTVLVLDIDYFKSINDSWGHDAGDDVLREFAVRIRKSIRGIDLACRYGGEEFVVVMPETDMAVATMVAERLRRRIATEPFPIQQGAKSIEVTISIGIAALERDEDAAKVFKRADQALYRAKRDGRNRVVPAAA